jgi:hypothetical protein
MIMRTLKSLIPTSLLVLFGCCCASEAADPPKLVGFSLHWTHPKLPPSPPIRINDAAKAMQLSSAFEDYYLPLDAPAYDCPMYDVIVTLYKQDGSSTDIKVYLPRQRAFPGMWKHPNGGLYYLDVDKKQPKILVDVLRPYIPTNSVYPTTMTNWPPVPFHYGIPDFREVSYPIFGDFSTNDFTRGGQ